MSKRTKHEYKVELSPYYNKNERLRANLKELKASDGEEVVLARKRYFKQDEYVKFIINDEFNITAFHALPKMSNTIMMYILYNCLEYNVPTFRFKVEHFAMIVSTNHSVIYKGMKALMDAKYFSKTGTKEIYWINHNMFYKGNFMIDKHIKTKKK